MQREFARRVLTAMSLPLILLIGCTDDKAPKPVQQSLKAERLFDTQRSALEEAKKAAGSAALRNQRFPENAKDID